MHYACGLIHDKNLFTSIFLIFFYVILQTVNSHLIIIQSRQKRVVWYTFSSPWLAVSLGRWLRNSCF